MTPKTPEKAEPLPAAAEPAETPTELELELDNEMKLDEEEGWVDEHELEMKAAMTATSGKESCDRFKKNMSYLCMI